MVRYERKIFLRRLFYCFKFGTCIYFIHSENKFNKVNKNQPKIETNRNKGI